MFEDKWFYHKTLRKVVTVFGTLFNNITVRRIDQNGDEVERYKVPVQYGPKERWAYRDDVDIQQEVNSVSPQLAFELTGLTYDPSRKLSKVKTFKNEQADSLKSQFTPAPYILNFSLYVISKFTDECNQIVEQILPYFTPNFTIQYLPIPEMNVRDDLHITLTSVSFEDNWDDDWTTKRNIIWKLDFDVAAYFYGPVTEQGLIREVIVNTHANIPYDEFGDIDGSLENLHKIPRVQRVVIQPDPITAGPNDDYGYTEIYTSYNDGKRYDPITGADVDVDE